MINVDFVVVYVSIASVDISHYHLAHSSLEKLHILVPSLPTLKSLQCELCHLGKYVGCSYSHPINKYVVSSFILVYFDICGPGRVRSTLKYYYFVIFIDVFSHCTWVFFNKKSFLYFFSYF